MDDAISAQTDNVPNTYLPERAYRNNDLVARLVTAAMMSQHLP